MQIGLTFISRDPSLSTLTDSLNQSTGPTETTMQWKSQQNSDSEIA